MKRNLHEQSEHLFSKGTKSVINIRVSKAIDGGEIKFLGYLKFEVHFLNIITIIIV